MLNHFQIGSLAQVIPGKGGNNVRVAPNGALVAGSPIPEYAVLALLPRPANWNGTYPYAKDLHVWWYMRSRTAKQVNAHHFEIIEGWTAANEGANDFLILMQPTIACHDAMGTALLTNLGAGQQAYVLPSEGLIIRAQPDPHSARVDGLAAGTVVTVVGSPVCSHKMVWWQVQPAGAPMPIGWYSEGSFPEWYLVPLSLH